MTCLFCDPIARKTITGIETCKSNNNSHQRIKSLSNLYLFFKVTGIMSAYFKISNKQDILKLQNKFVLSIDLNVHSKINMLSAFCALIKQNV